MRGRRVEPCAARISEDTILGRLLHEASAKSRPLPRSRSDLTAITMSRETQSDTASAPTGQAQSTVSGAPGNPSVDSNLAKPKYSWLTCTGGCKTPYFSPRTTYTCQTCRRRNTRLATLAKMTLRTCRREGCETTGYGGKGYMCASCCESTNEYSARVCELCGKKKWCKGQPIKSHRCAECRKRKPTEFSAELPSESPGESTAVGLYVQSRRSNSDQLEGADWNAVLEGQTITEEHDSVGTVSHGPGYAFGTHLGPDDGQSDLPAGFVMPPLDSASWAEEFQQSMEMFVDVPSGMAQLQ